MQTLDVSQTNELTVSKGLFRLAAFWFLSLLTILYVSDAFAALSDRQPCSLSEEQRKVRLKHAHELLGRYYKKSSAANGESISKINSTIYHWTKDHLPSKYKDQSGKIAQAIIDVSLKEGFDPVFLMSVIEGESSWRPDKVGGVGEIGLMQLRPNTGKWMASRAGVKWKGDKTLFDPVTNVKIGASYLHYLRDRFDDHARLYLAAYNMGQSNVDTALGKKIWPKDYPIHVMKRYVAFYESIGDSKAAEHADKLFSKASRASKKHLSMIARTEKKPAKKSDDTLTIVMRYTPHKKARPAVLPTEDDDTYFDIDHLVHASDDVNDPAAEQSADSSEDGGAIPPTTVGVVTHADRS